MLQIINSDIAKELLLKFKGAYMIYGDKYIVVGPSGEIIEADMKVANQITITDILIRFNTDVTFRAQFTEMIDKLQNPTPKKETVVAQDDKRDVIEKNDAEAATDLTQSEKITYTYLMHDAASGFYKIGKSKNVQFRESTLGGQIPLIKTICSAPVDIEGQLHSKYSEFRKRGEWFELSEEAVNEIKEALENIAA